METTVQYLMKDARTDAYYTEMTKDALRQRGRGVFTYCCGVEIEEYMEMLNEYVIARMRQPLIVQDGRAARVWEFIDMGRALPNRFYLTLHLDGKTVESSEIQFTDRAHVEKLGAMWVLWGSV
jgi:hypothetical protein